MQWSGAGGFPVEELVLARSPRDCRGVRVPEPVCIGQPEIFGLYRLQTSWLDPAAAPTSHLILAGKAPADYDASRHLLVGGIVGNEFGHLLITHSSRPGEVRATVRNGAFYAEPPICRRKGDDCWVEPYVDWSDRLVSVPGTLTFRRRRRGGPARRSALSYTVGATGSCWERAGCRD
jgi:hypothetical protein